MIYIWYNPDSRCYQLGSLKDFKDLRKTVNTDQEVPLLYKFPEQKGRLARKILRQLNSGINEQNNQEDENTFYRVY